MARSRNIKPGFFKNEELAELAPEIRLLFIGLWTLADREGRMEDRPKRVKAELFAFDTFDVDSMLNQLQAKGFVLRYEVSGHRFLEVVNFVKHQDPHYKEKASEIPSAPGGKNLIIATGVTRETRARIMERDGYVCRKCGADGYLSIDHIIPASRGGSGEDDNLQVLCFGCNGSKGNKLHGEKKGARRSKHADTSLRTRRELDSTSPQARANNPGSVPLIPDSLIPDSGSLIPDSLIPSPPIPIGIGCRPPDDQPQLALIEGGKTPSSPNPPDCPHLGVLALWAEVLPALPRHDPAQWRGARADHLRARWRETATAKGWNDRPAGLEYLRRLFVYVGRSRFLTGQVTPRDGKPPFVVTLAWLVKPENWAKTIEGNYHQDAA